MLLGVLALLWGSSYLFIKIAVQEIPPLTLIAGRVFGAALFLSAVIVWRRDRLPRAWKTWRMLFTMALFNSILSWTLLAWGQQFVGAGLASVLNSTSPIFVLIFTAAVTRHEPVTVLKLLGAITGIFGICVIAGLEALSGLGVHLAGQVACLLGAALYGAAAIYGTRFSELGAPVTAACTMICASAVLVPAAAIVDRPWVLTPSAAAIAAALILSIVCTGVALMLYFRLLRTLGSLGVASQAYLRAGFGVALGLVFLGEQLSPAVALGLTATVLGVAMINWPSGLSRSGR